MPVPSIVLLLLGLGCLAALLAALEAALSTLRDHQFAVLSRSEESPAVRRAVAHLRRHPQVHLLAVLVGGTVANLGIVVLVLYLILEHGPHEGMRRWLDALLVFGAIVVVVDLLPKSIALAHPKDTVRRFSRLLRVLQRLLSPAVRSIEGFSDRVVTACTPSHLRPRSLVTEDELATWIELRRDAGTLDEGESELIQEIIRFGAKTAKDLMTPRIDVFMLPIDLPAGEALARVRDQPHWHVPVYRDTPDTIVGVIDVRDLLLDDPDAGFRDHLRPPLFVPETMPAVDLLMERLAAPHRLAIVLDEYGGFEGIVTHSDVIEDLLADAAPPPDHEPEIQALGRGRLLVTGAARLDEIGDELGIPLEREGLDTIGGLVFTTLNRIPEPGTRIPLGPIVATVRQSSRTRIEELLLEPASATPGASPSDSPGDPPAAVRPTDDRPGKPSPTR